MYSYRRTGNKEIYFIVSNYKYGIWILCGDLGQRLKGFYRCSFWRCFLVDRPILRSEDELENEFTVSLELLSCFEEEEGDKLKSLKRRSCFWGWLESKGHNWNHHHLKNKKKDGELLWLNWSAVSFENG